MSNDQIVVVTLPVDVQQIDQTGLVWAFLDTAPDPTRVVEDALIVAGDSEEPFIARVVDIIEGPGGRKIVHLDIVGEPALLVDELRHANLLPHDRGGSSAVGDGNAGEARGASHTPGEPSLTDQLLEERRLRRRAGDPRVTPEDRELLLRFVRGDLAEEFADSLDQIAAADPALSGDVPD